VKLPRSSFQYKPREKNDKPVQDALEKIVTKHPAIGFWQSYYRLRNKGIPWNHKRVRRVYREMNLNIRRKPKKRLPERVKHPLTQPIQDLQKLSDNEQEHIFITLDALIRDFKKKHMLRKITFRQLLVIQAFLIVIKVAARIIYNSN